MSSSLVPFATNPDAPARRASASMPGSPFAVRITTGQARVVLMHPPHHVEPGHVRQRQVQQDDVGRVTFRLAAGLAAATGLARDLDLVDELQRRSQRPPERRMIVHHEHTHPETSSRRTDRRRDRRGRGRPDDGVMRLASAQRAKGAFARSPA